MQHLQVYPLLRSSMLVFSSVYAASRHVSFITIVIYNSKYILISTCKRRRPLKHLFVINRIIETAKFIESILQIYPEGPTRYLPAPGGAIHVLSPASDTMKDMVGYYTLSFKCPKFVLRKLNYLTLRTLVNFRYHLCDARGALGHFHLQKERPCIMDWQHT